MEIDPEDAAAWCNKALAFFKLELYEEAKKCYERALLIDPHYEVAWSGKRLVEERLRSRNKTQP
ncbi:MAG TPA: tetratricopeptide repeat protein [Methanomicrobia archaeon]|nr:tetratricopeptide repeat protein [Methanomicrobia archaeon]HEX59503.1 tetratricopeptide repeat protein [Methanomicrobia archaeon]